MSSKFRWLLAGSCALMFLVACATTPSRFPKVVVYGSQVSIDRVAEHTLGAGEPQVIVEGHSTASRSRSARYRAQWFDSEGRPIQTVVSTWFPMQMEGGRPFDMSFVGPGDRAYDYRIEIEILE